ncbi:MAG: glutathione S-transferase family protein [Pseudomonadota bacterium]
MHIHGDRRSGNCYKIQLAADLLSSPYTWHDVDILSGETRSLDFLALNPAGEVPLVVLDNGNTLSESNAVLKYLAAGTAYEPDTAFARAKVWQWQFWEQYNHEPRIAVARFIKLYQGLPPERQAEFDALQKPGHRALALMDRQLSEAPWLTGDQMTMADISLYAYTHVAGDGGFDLSDYTGITDWLARIESTPGYTPMQAG